MAILKTKKNGATFADISSPVVTKVETFLEKRGQAQNLVSEFEQEMASLKAEMASKQEQYKDTLDPSLLREMADLADKQARVQKLIDVQRMAFGNGKTKLELSDLDRKALEKTFAPYRQPELELTDKLVTQVAELEKTLNQLQDVRAEYHENFYGQMVGLAISATGDPFAIHFLKDNQPLRQSCGKLRELSYHKGFPQGFYD